MIRPAVTLFCTLLLGAVLAAPVLARPDPSAAGGRWALADRNADGSLDRSEAAALPQLAQHFERIDRNRDQRVDRDELREAWRLVSARRDLGQAWARAMRARFDWLDADQDGALTLAELGDRAPRLTERFAAIDADRNGRLLPGELREYVETQRGDLLRKRAR